jgi:periplasmic divalent cation tolerance protein
VRTGGIAEGKAVEYGSPLMKKPTGNVLVVLVTADSPKRARKIGQTLVKAKLAACVTIIPSVQSIYRWKGKVVTGREAVLVVKTTDVRYLKLERLIRAEHSYETPEIIAMPVTRGLHQYLEWVVSETSQ